MQLAQLSGLNVANSKVVNLGERVLEVERFDREVINNTLVERKHVIDGCQALDIAPEDKYERFLGDDDSVKDILGPANLANLYNFSNQCRNPAKTKLNILQWVIFNLLIGNSDNHLKNISFFIENKGIELAPFYDLVSVTIYPEIDHSMSFCIGEEFDPLLVDKNAIALMAHELDLKVSFVNRQANLVIEKVLSALHLLNTDDLNLNKKEVKFTNSLKEQIVKKAHRYKSVFKL